MHRYCIFCASLLICPLWAGDYHQMVKEEMASIHGRIIALPSCQPASAAEVSLYKIEGIDSDLVRSTLLKTLRTDVNGGYTFDGLGGGTYALAVRMPGFSTTRIWAISVWQGLRRMLDIGIRAAAGDSEPSAPNQIVGVTRSSSGDAIADATVVAIDADSFGAQWQARSDGNGWYRLALPHSGRYVVYSLKAGFDPVPICAIVPSQRRFDLTLAANGAGK